MSAKIADAIQVKGFDEVMPLPFSRCLIAVSGLAGNYCANTARLGASVSSTHSMPNDHPPITSLGQWTPSMTRLVPIRSERSIAAAAATRPARVCGQRHRQSQVKNHRARRVAAGKAVVLTTTRCGSMSGRDARDPIFLCFAESRPTEHNSDSAKCEAAAPARTTAKCEGEIRPRSGLSARRDAVKRRASVTAPVDRRHKAPRRSPGRAVRRRQTA